MSIVLRTLAQALVGAIIAWLVVHGVPVPADAAAAAVVLLTAVLAAIVAAVQRWAEKRWPALGRVLRRPRTAEEVAAMSAVWATVLSGMRAWAAREADKPGESSDLPRE